MNKKILVVDDDIDIVEPISLLLEGEGYAIESTTKGEQTYKKVEEYKPDLILLDILMSGNDGRTICKTLKSNMETKDIPVIMMSAHPGAEKDVKECKANDFIAKTFEIEDLLHTIHKNLN